MFDKEQKNFDALIVATPDHWHSHLVLAGLAMNKHIYCAKPITHTIAEARRVKAAVPGLQGHHQGEHSGFAHLLRPGHHGIAVERRHRPDSRGALLDRHLQPQRAGPTDEAQTPPEGMNWDQWCGPSPSRPYHKTYHYGNWRPWWDFGTGTVGDFGCHTLQMFHDELEMGAPDWVAAVDCQAFSLAGAVENTECMSIANMVQWHIPARGNHPEMMAYLLRWRPDAAPAAEHARRRGHAGQRDHVRGRKRRSGFRLLWRQPVAASSARNPGRARRFAACPAAGSCRRPVSRTSSSPIPTCRAARSRIITPNGCGMCKAGKKSITPVEFACDLTEFALLGTLAQRRYSMPVGAAGRRRGGGAGGAARGRHEAKVLAWDSQGHEIHQRRRGQHASWIPLTARSGTTRFRPHISPRVARATRPFRRATGPAEPLKRLFARALRHR